MSDHPTTAPETFDLSPESPSESTASSAAPLASPVSPQETPPPTVEAMAVGTPSMEVPAAETPREETPVAEPPVFLSQPMVAAPPPVVAPAPLVPGAYPTATAPHMAEPLAPEPVGAAAATNPLMAMLVGAVLACALLGGGILIGRSTNGGDNVMVASPMGSGVSSQSGNAIVQAVKEIGPAVMNVDTTFGQGKAEDFLPSPGEQGQPRAGKGTGFVIDSKRGLMLTNAHVVAGAEKIQVTTRDGDKYTGRVMGFDRRSDIAVVILSNKKLPQAKLATFKDARELPIGDWTIAIGNPFAQENTVTVGVLSAVGRTLPVPPENGREAFQLTDMMQTDTAINPGNSGGPLCNLRGEVIGINTAIIPFGQGLGFTIPINKAKAVADQIIKNGKVLHPYIGVLVVSLSDALQSEYGLPDKNGGLVKVIIPNSPAAKAGLEPGDVIRKIDDQVMKSNDAIVSRIGTKKVGDSVKLEILRNSSIKKTVTLKVGDQPD